MTDPTNPIPAPAAADTASFRTPSGDGQAVTDLTGLSPQSAGFFMSPEAAVRTHGLGIVEALVTDGVNPRHALELLAVHMSMPTGLPRVEGAGEPAHVEIMGARAGRQRLGLRRPRAAALGRTASRAVGRWQRLRRRSGADVRGVVDGETTAAAERLLAELAAYRGEIAAIEAQLDDDGRAVLRRLRINPRLIGQCLDERQVDIHDDEAVMAALRALVAPVAAVASARKVR